MTCRTLALVCVTVTHSTYLQIVADSQQSEGSSNQRGQQHARVEQSTSFTNISVETFLLGPKTSAYKKLPLDSLNMHIPILCLMTVLVNQNLSKPTGLCNLHIICLVMSPFLYMREHIGILEHGWL